MADPSKFVVPTAVEQQSGVYTAILRDENGVLIGAGSLTTLTLTLYDLNSAAIINSRTAQNVLNANQVTLDSSGHLVWTWLPADMQIFNTNRAAEEHVALFIAKWTDSQGRLRQANHEVHFVVNRIPLLA